MDIRAIALGLFFVAAWSSAFAAARLIVADAPPFLALSVRFLISGTIALAVGFALGQRIRFRARVRTADIGNWAGLWMRVDGATRGQAFIKIILPLAAPALAVLAIFSVVWRWNDFLWPLIVLSRKELFTLQIGLNSYAGELNVQWQFILAMTVVSIIPVLIVFFFLQRFITAGIAGTGLK